MVSLLRETLVTIERKKSIWGKRENQLRDIERMMKLAETVSSHAQLDKLVRLYREPLQTMGTLEKAYGRDFLARNTGLSLYLERLAQVDRDLGFQLPRGVEEIVSLHEKLARAIDPFPGVFASRPDWELSLADRMNALHRTWILRD